MICSFVSGEDLVMIQHDTPGILAVVRRLLGAFSVVIEGAILLFTSCHAAARFSCFLAAHSQFICPLRTSPSLGPSATLLGA